MKLPGVPLTIPRKSLKGTANFRSLTADVFRGLSRDRFKLDQTLRVTDRMRSFSPHVPNLITC